MESKAPIFGVAALEENQPLCQGAGDVKIKRSSKADSSTGGWLVVVEPPSSSRIVVVDGCCFLGNGGCRMSKLKPRT